MTIKEQRAIAEKKRLAEIEASYAPNQILYQYDETKRIVLTRARKDDPCNSGYAYFENTEQGIKQDLDNLVLMGKDVVISRDSDNKDTIIIPIAKYRTWCGKLGRCDGGSFILYSFDGGKTLDPLSWPPSVHVPTFIAEKNKFYIVWQSSFYDKYSSPTASYKTCSQPLENKCKYHGLSRKFEVVEFTIDKSYTLTKEEQEDRYRVKRDLTRDSVQAQFLTNYKHYVINVFDKRVLSQDPDFNTPDALNFPTKYYDLITQLDDNRAQFAECRVTNPILLN